MISKRFRQEEIQTPNEGTKKRKTDKTAEFIRYASALNLSLKDYFKSQVASLPHANLSDALRDYIDYAKQLEDRYLRRYGEVLTFGSGDCGQLAHGVDNDEDLMVRYPRIVYALRDKQVCGISCGGLHNAVYTTSGLVYTWGCADDGSLGRSGEESTPLLVDSLQNETVVSVACGDGQTIALTAAGEVYGWGCYKDKEGKKFFNLPDNNSIQHKSIKNQQNEPIRIVGFAYPIVEIACGSAFCLGRTSNGQVYSWGISESGEFGRVVPPLKISCVDENGEPDMTYDTKTILALHLTPQLMCHYPMESSMASVPIDQVKSIGCGSYHTFVITVGGKIYSCGLNNYSQLGQGGTETKPILGEIVSLRNKGVIAAKGGVHHSLVLTNRNELYSFGRGDSGQLGIKGYESKAAGAFSEEPLLVELPGFKDGPSAEKKSIVSIACGGNHNLALTSTNELYTWGYGDMLALGHGVEKDEIVPRKVNFTKAKIGHLSITQVSGGGQHSAIVGEVLSAV